MKLYENKKINKNLHGLRGFSLIEIMLVLGVATGLLLLAFMMNKGRQDSLAVEDARSQITKIVASLAPIKNTLNTYTPMIPETGLTPNQMRTLLPKELFDARGELSSSFGAIDIRALSLGSPSDSYAISYTESTQNFCSQLATKVYDQFYQVRIGSSIDLSAVSNIAWTRGEQINPEQIAAKCANLSGAKVVQFISDPLKAYNGTSSSIADSATEALAPVSLSQAMLAMNASIVPTGVVAPLNPASAPATSNIVVLPTAYENVDIGGGTPPPTPTGGGNSCAASSVSWGSGCTGTVASANSGASVVASNNATGYVGGVQMTCNNGAWGQTDATCYQAGCAARTVNWGGGCSGSIGNTRSGNSATATSVTTYTGSITYSCYLGNWSIGASSCNPPAPPPPPPDNGACGWAQGQNYASAPTMGLCSVGTAGGVYTGVSSYTWTCYGANGGTNASCSAGRSVSPPPPPPPVISGVCGWANGQSYSTAPAAGLCSAGTQSGVSTNATSYTWSCYGSGGGWNASCLASRTVTPYIPPQCPAFYGNFDWGGSCGAYIGQPASAVGTYVAVTNTKSGASGSINFSCGAGGSWQVASQTCNVVAPAPASRGIQKVVKTQFGGILSITYVTAHFDPGTGTISISNHGENLGDNSRIYELKAPFYGYWSQLVWGGMGIRGNVPTSATVFNSSDLTFYVTTVAGGG